MRLKSLINPTAWADFGIELMWEVLPPQKSNITFSWPLDKQKLTDISVLWPAQYNWPPIQRWVLPLLHGFQKYLKVKITKIAQPYVGVVFFYIIFDGKEYPIGIDVRDDLEYINKDCQKKSFLYFKMQYSNKGYSFNNVVPGGFINREDKIYYYLPHIRAVGDKKDYLCDVYGRFGTDFAMDKRSKAISLLSEQKDFKYNGGLNRVRYSRFLKEIATSKICIDIIGNGDFCFRLIDYMAVGTCIIALKHRTILNAPLIDREHIVYMKDDLSDLVSLCNYYLANDGERERIVKNSRDFFNKYLHREQLAAYYLFNFFNKVEAL